MFAVRASQIAKSFGSTRAPGMFRAQVLLSGQPFTARRLLVALVGETARRSMES